VATPNTKLSSVENRTLIMQLDMLATISIIYKMFVWCGLGVKNLNIGYVALSGV